MLAKDNLGPPERPERPRVKWCGDEPSAAKIRSRPGGLAGSGRVGQENLAGDGFGELYKNLYWGLVGFRKLKLFTYLGAPNPHSMCEATRVSEEKMSRVGSCPGISASI